MSSKFKFPAVIFFFLMYSFQRVFLPNLLPAVKCFQTSSWLSFPFFRIVSHCVGQTSLELVILLCPSAKSTIHGCPLPPVLEYLVLISSLIYCYCSVLPEFFVMIFALNANPLILSSLILFYFNDTSNSLLLGPRRSSTQK